MQQPRLHLNLRVRSQSRELQEAAHYLEVMVLLALIALVVLGVLVGGFKLIADEASVKMAWGVALVVLGISAVIGILSNFTIAA